MRIPKHLVRRTWLFGMVLILAGGLSYIAYSAVNETGKSGHGQPATIQAKKAGEIQSNGKPS